ncbi:MAG: hypothetical protein ACYSWU_04770 [Planctomycetota bacterium]
MYPACPSSYAGFVPGAVAVAGRYAFVTHGHWGLRVFDVSGPASPEPVCLHDSPLGP